MIKVDISLTQDSTGLYDIGLAADGDLATTQGFDTALLMSILCERRADSSEVPNPLHRRGWIGNQFSKVPGFEIGSKVWIYEQSRLNNDTLNGIKGAALSGVEWLINDGLVVKTSAVIEKQGNGAYLAVTTEASNSIVEQRYFSLWEATGVA